jgi:hypothetical protein
MAAVAPSSSIDPRLVLQVAGDAFRDRVVQMGERESGAYGFYKNRLERGECLPAREWALVDSIRNLYGSGHALFLEIGAGVGFLSMALAATGFHAIAVEADPRRFQAAEYLRGILVKSWPELDRRLLNELVRFGESSPQCDVFDDISANSVTTVGVCTNLVSGWARQNYSHLVREMLKFDQFIIDVLTFGEKRDRQQKDEVLAMFPTVRTELFLDSMASTGGTSGMYYRFTVKAKLHGA